ncbi:MAG: hypothetical protein ACI90V_012928 [Bacillariaceae sp.]|jgi:hypothetical protein
MLSQIINSQLHKITTSCSNGRDRIQTTKLFISKNKTDTHYSIVPNESYSTEPPEPHWEQEKIFFVVFSDDHKNNRIIVIVLYFILFLIDDDDDNDDAPPRGGLISGWV